MMTFLPSLGSRGSSSSGARPRAVRSSVSPASISCFHARDRRRMARRRILGRVEVRLCREQATVANHDLFELLVAPSRRRVALLVGDDLGVGQARFDLQVLPFEVGEAVEHGSQGRHRDARGSRRQRRKSSGTVTISAGSAKASARRRVTGMRVTLGDHQQQAGRRAHAPNEHRRPPGRGPDRRRPNTRRPRSSPSMDVPIAIAGDGSLRFSRRTVGSIGSSSTRPDQRRLTDKRAAQPPLAGQARQRMGEISGAPVLRT